jgi:hypothetical protein
MPDDTPSHPLLKVYNDIGKITKGIQGLEKGQDKLSEGQEEVEQKVSDLHQTVSKLVTSEECEAKHGELEDRVESVEACAGAAKEVTDKGWFTKIADNAGNITKILTLLGCVGVGLWAVHRFVSRVELALERTSGQHTKATKQLIQRLDTPHEPQLIYVPVTIKPDAGAPRRRRRRPRRRATP